MSLEANSDAHDPVELEGEAKSDPDWRYTSQCLMLRKIIHSTDSGRNMALCARTVECCGNRDVTASGLRRRCSQGDRTIWGDPLMTDGH